MLVIMKASVVCVVCWKAYPNTSTSNSSTACRVEVKAATQVREGVKGNGQGSAGNSFFGVALALGFAVWGFCFQGGTFRFGYQGLGFRAHSGHTRIIRDDEGPHKAFSRK